MHEEPFSDTDPDEQDDPLQHLRAEKPTIKILLYTDDPNEITRDTDDYLAIGSMIQRLEAHAPAFARLRIDWVSRSSRLKKHADNKLNVVLQREQDATGQTYDEIWFFGVHQARLKKFSLGVFRGGPESELDQAEVETLKNWMTAGNAQQGAVGGGLLITGDHSNERPLGIIPGTNPSCPNSSAEAEFLGLGRALGRCVPRARLLRQWDGGPTYRDEDSYNTIEGSGFQLDAIPQQLFHKNVNAAGEPDPAGQPHPLFFYKPGISIKFFPDHAHEGAVIVPEGELDPTEWPVVKDEAGNDVQPRPHVLACGVDRRHNKMLNLIAAYNGDRVNVGRIVADSTWHHYANINLSSFAHPAPEGSASDQIGQFYGNLAVWLSPKSKRREMAHAMSWRLATFTMLLEGGTDVQRVGQTALSTLSQMASPCEIHEMFQALAPARFSELYFPDREAISPMPSKELLLGSILRSYHEEMIRAETTEESYKQREVDDIVEEGFLKAFQAQADRLSHTMSEAHRLLSNKPV